MVGIEVLGFINHEVAWVISSLILLSLQLLLAVAGCLGGYTKHVNSAIHNVRRGLIDFVFGKKRV